MRLSSLLWDYRNSNPALDAEQRQAVEAILTSTHFVTLFRGGAGREKATPCVKWNAH